MQYDEGPSQQCSWVGGRAALFPAPSVGRTAVQNTQRLVRSRSPEELIGSIGKCRGHYQPMATKEALLKGSSWTFNAFQYFLSRAPF